MNVCSLIMSFLHDKIKIRSRNLFVLAYHQSDLETNSADLKCIIQSISNAKTYLCRNFETCQMLEFSNHHVLRRNSINSICSGQGQLSFSFRRRCFKLLFDVCFSLSNYISRFLLRMKDMIARLLMDLDSLMFCRFSCYIINVLHRSHLN